MTTIDKILEKRISPNYPYTALFFLKNQDPYNYVLYKDFFFYSIIATYVFLVWYYVTVMMNYNFMTKTNQGSISWYFALLSAVSLFIVATFGMLYTTKNFYPLLGLSFTLVLISIGLTVFSFQTNEIDRGFENDPVQLGYIFLILYSFVSFFIV